MGASLNSVAGGNRTADRPPAAATPADLTACQLEVERLRAQVQSLSQENDLLREAAALSSLSATAGTLAAFAPTVTGEALDAALAAAAATGGRGHPFGTGSFGHVFKALWCGNPAAVKVPGISGGCCSNHASENSWVQGLLRELQVAQRVRCEHLVPIVAVCPSRQAVVYPWAEGQSLQDMLQQASPPSPLQGLGYLLGAAKALRSLHLLGLVHTDVRSDHVLLFAVAEGRDGRLGAGEAEGGGSGSGSFPLEFKAQLGGCSRVVVADDHQHCEFAGRAGAGGEQQQQLQQQTLVPPLSALEASRTAEPYRDPCSALLGRAFQSSDVFSLGVVLLEVLLGRSAAAQQRERETGEDAGADAATHTRRPRPKHLWLQFRERLLLALSEHQGVEGRGDGGGVTSSASVSAFASSTSHNSQSAASSTSAVLGMMPPSEEAREQRDWERGGGGGWGEEALLVGACLLAEMLELGACGDWGQAPQLGRLLAPRAATSPPAAAASPPTWQVPPRPTVAETLERLEVAMALQAAVLPEEEEEDEEARRRAEREPPRERLCVVCLDLRVDARLQPCQHAALCSGCASLCVGRQARCPICRGVVDGYDLGDFQSTFAAF